MTNDKEWQNKYYNLLEEQEDTEKANKDMESLLCRTISNLATVSSGFDTSLDPHLNKLKEVVRGGASPALKEHLVKLSDEIMRAEDHSRIETTSTDTNTPQSTIPTDKLASKLARLCHLQGSEADQFKQLSKRLLTDPESLSKAEFGKWISSIKPSTEQTASDNKKTGFISRIFANNSPESKQSKNQQEKINQLLRELLEKLQWPNQWKQDIESFCLHLAESAEADEWKAVIKSISTLAYHTFGAANVEINEAEDFLAELTQRLHELDSHIIANQRHRQSTLESGHELNKLVSNQVGTIGITLDNPGDLKSLKQDIRQSLDKIQEHVDNFAQDNEIRHKEGEDNDSKLKERLSELENETKELRVKMLDAHHLALQDSVTGLPNRTAYEERMGQEFIRWKRFGEPLSMLVWDIDDFKSVNDRFGHQAGDKALKVIANTLKKRLRESDFIARYGGEEFVCLLSGTDKETAFKVAEEMRQSVSESGFHTGSKAIVLTASCGISAFAGKDTPANVFARADKALYTAKGSGKNRCNIL